MKFKQKLISAILAVMMLTGYITTLGNVAIAVTANLADQNSKTNHANVEFNSYFEEEVHSKTFEIENQAKLYLKIKVSNTGYLKNGVVKFNDANFEVDSNNLKSDKVQSSSKNEIKLKQINNSSESTVIEVPVVMVTGETVSRDAFEKETIVTFEGTYLDENGKEKAINKEIKNELKWKGSIEVELGGEVSKYTPYELGGEKGVLVQVRVQSGVKDNSLPIAKTKLEVSIPEINIAKVNETTESESTQTSIKPERITVIANTTKASNGKESTEFSEQNYSYNEETGKIEIEVVNSEENGKIAWNKNVIDEYLVNYVYTGEEVYNYVKEQLAKAKETIKTEEEKKAGEENENAITGEIEVKAEIEAYNSEETKKDKTGKIKYSIEEAKGQVTNTTIKATEKVSKGYIYANYAKAEKEEKKQAIEAKRGTNYEVNYKAQIVDKTLVEGIEITTVSESYVDTDGEKHSSKVGEKENITTKSVKISEAVFKKILGEEGKIEILTKTSKDNEKDQTKLAEITKDSKKDSNGNYIVDISESKVNEIIIKTSKPITEGNITLTVEKVIEAEQSYTKTEMESFGKIALNTQNVEVNLTEPVSKAEISVGTKNLSTVVENKDVEIRVVLDTSSNENALYKNPTLQVLMPENIEKLNIKSADILLDDELKIKDKKVVEQNGRKIIQIVLEGTQTKYMDNGVSNNNAKENVIAKGANIVIKADITFKKLAPSANTSISLYYTNENTNLFEEYYKNPNQARAMSVRTMSARVANTPAVGLASTGIEIVSPNGVVTENRISGYKENGAPINNITTETQVQTIDTYSTAREVTIGGTIVNNYANAIEGTLILGRLPFAGNKKVDGTQELGSNFTMKMKNKITTNGIDASKVKVYYSTNGEANKNLIDGGNGWTETPSNLEEVKSYLIVMAGEIASGTQFNFDYKVELPANLEYEKSVYTTYTVYYDNKTAEATLLETKVAGVVGLTTGEGPNLEVKLTSNVAENAEVREGQIVRYHLEVKNNGKIAAQNAVANITVPAGATLTTYNFFNKEYNDTTDKKISIGNVGAGETVTRYYELRMLDLAEDMTSEDMTTQVRIATKDSENGVPSNNYTVKKTAGKMTIIYGISRDQDILLNKGNVLKSSIYVKAKENLNNVVLTAKIPAGVKINDVSYYKGEEELKDNIQINENVVTITIPSLEQYDTFNAKLELEIESLTGEFTYMVTGKADGIPTHYSNNLVYQVGTPKFEITQNSINEKYVKEAQQFNYEFTIKNTGNSDASNFVFEDKIPEGLTFVKLQYTYNGETKEITSTLNNIVKLRLSNFKQGATCNVKVTVKADLLGEDKREKEVTNSATIEAQGVDKIQSNTITNIIEYNSKIYEGQTGNQGGNTPGTTPGDTNTDRYKITGTAWIDSNKDGKRDESEELLSGVQVMLINKSNSNIVTDIDNGNQKITTTDSNGKYEFSNIPSGEYLVVFLYDSGKYSITEYQVKQVGASYNSDAISMKITLDGEQRYAGVTDTIKITSGHARDIDIGVYIAEKFDLRLDKYISKVTVTTPTSGTKVYNYNNSKITKREILGKDVNKSSAVIEYKIVVTNEGQVAGYAKKLIDYLPEDVKFSSELNKDWYISDNNGAVYNTSLANEKIEPGQSKEVTLILSLNITDKNIGTVINNNAEIYESYNEQGVKDYDSIEANRLESEDDMSNADIILSIMTGSIILYTTLGITIIFLLGMGALVIKKKVLTKKK